MMFTLRRFGALAGAVALALGMSACTDLTASSSSSAIDYSACSTNDSSQQTQNVDRSGTGNFPAVSGDDKPVISVGKGNEPTDKVLVKTLKQGDGAVVCPGATIKANYVGALWDGTVFDSSFDRGQAATFSLDRVVKGWSYGLAHAHVGDRVQLVIPATLGYGSQAAGSIPANSTLVFVVDIVSASVENIADESVLTGATATGEELPAGITVTGDPAQEPTLSIDDNAAAPTERKVYVIYQGSGEELTDDQAFLYKAVGGVWGTNGHTESTWGDSIQQGGVAQAGLAGYTVGSRLLLVLPSDNGADQSGQSGEQQSGQSGQAPNVSVLVIDIVGTLSMQ